MVDPAASSLPRFWVLLRHKDTDESVFVLKPAENIKAAEAWGRDCERGMWEFVVVTEELPRFLPLVAFEYEATRRDPKWYRPATPRGGLR